MIKGTCVGVVSTGRIDIDRFIDTYSTKLDGADIEESPRIRHAIIDKYIIKDVDINGNILKDSKSFYCNPSDVKKNIENNVIELDNLKINNHGYLEFISLNKEIPSLEHMSIDELDSLLLITGGKLVSTSCGHKCIIIYYDTHTELIIPSNVTMPISKGGQTDLLDSLSKVKGKLKVIGGENVVDAADMFFGCELEELDLTEFNMQNLEIADRMFHSANIYCIKFPEDCKTAKLKSAKQMFCCFEGSKIDLNGLDTSNVYTMEAMFENCSCDEIIINSLNISKVITMEKMFIDASFEELDISNWEISKIKNTKYIFKDCEVQKEIKLSNTDKNNKRIQRFRACWSKEERDAHPINNWYHDMKKAEKYGYDYW